MKKSKPMIRTNRHYNTSNPSKNKSPRIDDDMCLKLVRGIGEKWAGALQKAGIESVAKLSEMTPEVVRMKLDRISYNSKEYMHRLPSRMTIADWIIAASHLRRKSQQVVASPKFTYLLQLMNWMGIDPVPFEPYGQDESIELEIVKETARFRYLNQVFLRIIFFLLLFFFIISAIYIAISRTIIFSHFVNSRESIRFFFKVLAGEFGVVFFLTCVICLVELWLYLCFSTLVALKHLSDPFLLKLIYSDNNDIRLFAVRWGKALHVMMRGTLRLLIGIFIVVGISMCIIVLFTYDYDFDFITMKKIPLIMSIVFPPLCGLLGIKICISDVALFRWITRHPASAKLLFGSKEDDTRRWHTLVVEKRGIDGIWAFCCLLLGLVMSTVGTTIIFWVHNQIFAPAMQMWIVEIIRFGPHNMADFSIDVPYLLSMLMQKELVFVICSGFVIFFFFYVVMPYLVNKGLGFVICFFVLLFIGLIFDSTISRIQAVSMGLVWSNYYTITICFIYALFKIVERIISNKVEKILNFSPNTRRECDY